jgi:hypothetical protein
MEQESGMLQLHQVMFNNLRPKPLLSITASLDWNLIR